MFLKAAFKNASVFVQLLMIMAVISFCMIVFSFLSGFLIAFKTGMSPETIRKVMENILDYPDIIREAQFLQTLGLFLFPSIICAWLFSDNYKEYFGIDQPFYKSVAVWTIISMIVAVPFLNLTYSFNQQMAFPEVFKGLETWMKKMEDTNDQATEAILNTKNISTIIFNFLIVCVVAAISEEFMFRGLLQKFFGRVIKNPHILIWTVAILFSAIHLQFYGFITRMLLGAWLGYLMYYTKTIWIPVLAHFINNFLTVGAYYLFQNTPDKIKEFDAVGTGATWWLAAASLALFFFSFIQIKKAINQ